MTDIVITPGRITAGGVATLTVKVDGEAVDVQQVNLGKPKYREAFIDGVISKFPDADRAALTDSIIRLAAEIAQWTADTGSDEKASQSTLIIELVNDSDAKLFHDADGTAFATLKVGEHIETHRVNSRAFKRWAGRLHYEAMKSAANAQSISDAITTIEGIAVFDGPEQETYLRVAPEGDRFVIDLGDRDWTSIVVSKNGWNLCDSAETPVRFRRAAGMRALPQPIRVGRIDELRNFVNIGGDDQWALLVAWLVAAFRPTGPYPVFAVHGRHGSAKSSLCRYARALIDPSSTPLRRPPKEERDLMIAASNSWVVAYDNLSGISPSLSDGLCVLATGGGFGTRELYSDADERLFNAMRPTMVNGIDDLATRSDLLDRCLNISLPVISESGRRDEGELNAAFEAAKPRILGAILDAVATALRNQESVKLERMPRMADFAIWTVAAEPALSLAPGAFLDSYLGNREEANALAVESSPIGTSLQALMTDCSFWNGTASALLDALNDERISDERTRRQRDWPKNARGMRSALERLAPNLVAAGLTASLPTTRTGHSHQRIIRIEKVPARQGAQGASAAPPPYDPEMDGLDLKECDLSQERSCVGSGASAVDRAQAIAIPGPETPFAPHAPCAPCRAGPSSELADDYSAAMEVLREEAPS